MPDQVSLSEIFVELGLERIEMLCFKCAGFLRTAHRFDHPNVSLIHSLMYLL